MRQVLHEYPSQATAELAQAVRQVTRPLVDDRDLDPLLERIGDARCVLLGEASHGTSEYYTWRRRISQRLILEKGFSFIAVEGDWPDCYRVNRYVKGYPEAHGTARDALHAFDRWPTWMWANEEVVGLAGWLREHNRPLPEERRVGFYGLDVYSLWDSLNAILRYLEQVDPAALQSAWRAFQCFEPFGEDLQEYGWHASLVPQNCEPAVVNLLTDLRHRATEYQGAGTSNSGEAYFNAEQNALVARNAERYYRTMVRGGPTSWNVRDTHMMETLDRLLQHHGRSGRAIVWEHNTHVGDARATDMAQSGMVNVGQLVRERFGLDDAVLVGFGSHRGQVIAGRSWGAPMQRMIVPPAMPGSWEDVLHKAGAARTQQVARDALFITRDGAGIQGIGDWRGHRAIGVVYNPENEAFGNYVPTQLPQRYDAFLYVDRSHGVRPLHMTVQPDRDLAETYPSGV